MDRFTVVERALRAAAPHALLDALRSALQECYAAQSVDLLMADYAMTILQPVTRLPYTDEPLSVFNSPAGRAFGAQEVIPVDGPDAGQVTAHLPVTVRGDRIGVLSVVLARAAADASVVTELRELAEVLGREIVVADRDTDLYLQARRASRLTLAAEIQWQLLPGRSCARPEYELGAQLEPAYAIHGDNFDWSTSADHLTLTLANGMGEGIEAALLTNLTVNALRNARRAGLDLAGQAALADQAVFGAYQGRAHIAALMLRFDLATGHIEALDAGSPKIWRLRQGEVEPLLLEAQLPLGMFEETVYTPQSLPPVLPGDRLLFVSDGVYDALSPLGERYSRRALQRALLNTRLLPPTQVPRSVLEQVVSYRDSVEPDDDAMVVCMDWHGRPDAT
ncbi:PP2C family protein-serine/threonine phosphatase [Streptomyces indicus]|uniref:Serine phosphatase RsbU, regulator of sigma subunit n=1 Tax=Streptomyces indicus TaxID=417292 RepID=A0A1G8T4R9_9ACTN|nr:PP2C family protein-serine/threonine phosphatase [Streptomyces indicus]SDJ36404.1 Serine phosphatase RsbU, regulator of sigma subunit [Streptomyces indicus]